MKTTFVVAALQALSLSPSSVWADSPVAKAISLLSDLESKIIKEGEAAQKIYAEFSEFCEDHSRQIAHDIKTGQAEVAELNAVIGEADGTSGSLTAKIEQLTSDISVDEADLKAATEIRSKEQESFHTSEKELVEVVDTLQRAIGILEREMKKGGASMLQLKGAKNLVSALETMVQASMLSTSDAKRLTALVQSSEDDQDDGFVQPTAAPYESHSGDIVQTLSDLLDKAEEQLESVRKQETQDLQAPELIQQSLKDETEFAEQELAEATSSLAATSEKKAKAEGNLAMTTKEVLADSTGAAADVSYSFVQVPELPRLLSSSFRLDPNDAKTMERRAVPVQDLAGPAPITQYYRLDSDVDDDNSCRIGGEIGVPVQEEEVEEEEVEEFVNRRCFFFTLYDESEMGEVEEHEEEDWYCQPEGLSGGFQSACLEAQDAPIQYQ